MKAVILAGGFGTRISEESILKPKPMIEIGGMPILWHLMKIYSAHGINEFIICLGYKGYVIKEYFANYFLHMSDVTFNMENNSIEIHNPSAEPWKVTLVDTGQNSMTGERLKQVKSYIDDENFCFTYGDGLADIDISTLIKFHENSKKLATVTAVQPPGRFGALEIDLKNNSVSKFQEKPEGDGAWINAGFFVLSKKVFKYLDGKNLVWEEEPLSNLAKDNQLSAYKHSGFWKPMDTLRDKNSLEEMWSSGNALWKKW
ncbi:glucose-1-phosphate cytidylyltransferase [Gammaproteobacteria bacterium]|nr:glucose-1-phosphate cytidylyltransferase [Gammaproteobacteria bacterium]